MSGGQGLSLQEASAKEMAAEAFHQQPSQLSGDKSSTLEGSDCCHLSQAWSFFPKNVRIHLSFK